MTIKFYNSLSRQKEEFVPLDADHIKIYACGPTVYNYAHIGNARMAVVFDQWVRLMKSLYPKVTYVSNITDVEDKIMVAAKEAGVPILEITEKYTRIYNEDMASLGVNAPDIQPKATEHIDDMIALTQVLIDKGHAYAAEGHVLFDVPSDPSYGALSGRSRDEQIAGARVEVAPYKRDPADFVLWKPSSDDQVGWDSPWGRGRPGWHIECSAMAEQHLGLPFDIHGGGADLKFPHHENEIAQSCCANDTATDPTSFAKYWLHNGFVTVEGEKMSKSLGNFLLVHDVIEKFPGPVLRIALLMAHYRQPLDWSDQLLHQSGKLYERIQRAYEILENVDSVRNVDFKESVTSALLDDLNTPLAISRLNSLLSSIFSPEVDEALPNLKGMLEKAIEILGIDVVKDNINDSVSDDDVIKIETLLAERIEAKDNKDYKRSDEIRDELIEMGIAIKDTREGTSWEKI